LVHQPAGVGELCNHLQFTAIKPFAMKSHRHRFPGGRAFGFIVQRPSTGIALLGRCLDSDSECDDDHSGKKIPQTFTSSG